MNERIKELAENYLMHERFSRYGESIEEDYYEFYPEELEKFAELIAADEREACAKLCEQRAISGEHYVEGGAESQGCAEAIREREVDNELILKKV